MVTNRDRLEDTLILGYGRNLIIPVYGEESAQGGSQSTLKRIFRETKGNLTYFALQPQDDYQREHGWPVPPFVNVIPAEAGGVSRKDWLGYIYPMEFEPEDTKRQERHNYIKKLIWLRKFQRVLISGKIIKEEQGYSVLLFASRKQIDGAVADTKARREAGEFRDSSKTKPFYQRWWFWAIVAFIAMCYLAEWYS